MPLIGLYAALGLKALRCIFNQNLVLNFVSFWIGSNIKFIIDEPRFITSFGLYNQMFFASRILTASRVVDDFLPDFYFDQVPKV
jgi:hypothetical protein